MLEVHHGGPGGTNVKEHYQKRVQFDKCVNKYKGNYKVTKFTCLDQFYCMAFAQLTYRESLRDLITCLTNRIYSNFYLNI